MMYQCPIRHPQGDEVNIPVGGGLNVAPGNAVETVDGNDNININGGSVTADSVAINPGNGDDTVTVNGGNLSGCCKEVSRLFKPVEVITISL